MAGEERAPLAYDDARHGFRLTDETYTLPPVRISRKEAFSFGLACKLLAHDEGIGLSKSGIDFFKKEAKRHHTQYQRMIRTLLDLYVAQHQ